MHNTETSLKQRLQTKKQRWAVTGAAGFIGSHLLERLLSSGQTVVAIDNFSTGRKINLETVKSSISAEDFGRLTVVEADVRDPKAIIEALKGVDIVLHQAAISSVAFSKDKPLETFGNNADGFLNILVCALAAAVKKIVYASSAAVYGEPDRLPLPETAKASPISLYGLTKKINEDTAAIYGPTLSITGLRYFNVYGPRQSPSSAYAGVISKFARQIASNLPLIIFGDGKNSRDFIYVEDIVHANILAALDDKAPGHRIYNVATGNETTLLDLIRELSTCFGKEPEIKFEEFKEQDIRRSVADVSSIKNALGFSAQISFQEGLKRLVKEEFPSS